uniref:Reverse transcriptase domain-containing protein n=2 Tax=Tanacetum cinerariifolium TaxID=118510 RepID=A0A6L2LDT6_TANCI|nr:hypothetical protein [Tanacetum cinerariifolium]
MFHGRFAPMQPIQVNNITSSCEICSGPHGTQYCMENPEQAFVEYASSRTDEAGGDNGDLMFIEIIKQDDDSHIEEPEVGENEIVGESEVEYFDIFPTKRPEYPEYLPPADDVLPAEEQPLPATISPTAESSGYIIESEPEMEPEEEDGDDEKSEEDSIDYPTNGGDNDGNDLSEDDADDKEEEESSNKPFEEGETAATPPPFGYRVAARIPVQPHILMPFRLESKVERLLAIPTPPLSPVSPTSYPLPPFLMPLPIFTPLPTSSFPLPLSLPSTSGNESIPEADIPLRKRAPFTTATGGYEIMDYCRSQEVHTSTLVTQMEALQRDKMAPKKAAPERTTRINPGATTNPNLPPSTTTITVTNAQLQAMINKGVNTALAAHNANRTGDDSHTPGTGIRRTECITRECTYQDFMRCQPLYFKGTEGVVELTQWFERMETVFRISNCLAKNQIKFATCILLAGALTNWPTCPKESDRVERYICGLPETIHGSVAASKPKTMQEATEMATGLMDKKIRTYAERQAANKRKFDVTPPNWVIAEYGYPGRIYLRIDIGSLELIKDIIDPCCFDNPFISDGAKRYGAPATGATPRIRSIWNSTNRDGGRPGKFSGNTSGKSWMIASAVALGIYLAYVPYEEEFQYLAFILGILVPVIVLAIGVDLCLKK